MQIRAWVCYGMVLFGGFCAGAYIMDAAYAWREWHRWAVADPSAADLYRTDFRINIAIAAMIICVVGLVYRLLRPNSGTSHTGVAA